CSAAVPAAKRWHVETLNGQPWSPVRRSAAGTAALRSVRCGFPPAKPPARSIDQDGLENSG
ncbi:MAG TPA: hypothetical protein VH599_10200, partial [Ktedonobacterales bacterium]